jgi:hypothetical protein
LSTGVEAGGVFRRLRETGPVLLVPLAWSFVTAAHLELVGDEPVVIAHAVMAVLLAGFAATGYRDMREGVLRVWWWIIVVGLGITLLGGGLLAVGHDTSPLLAVTVVGWMLLPAAGLLYTARRVDRTPMVYVAAAGLSVAGAVAYVPAVLAADGPTPFAVALTLANVGQTAGIVATAIQY